MKGCLWTVLGMVVLVIAVIGVKVVYPMASFRWSKSWDKEATLEHIRAHAEPKSVGYCAGYVRQGLNAGGCPALATPAFLYKQQLEILGFGKVGKRGYEPRKGDIVVFPAVRHHPYGHIAIYDGKRWISDFVQKGFYVNKAYIDSDYTVFRMER